MQNQSQRRSSIATGDIMSYQKWFNENKSTTIPENIKFGDPRVLMSHAYGLAVGFIHFEDDRKKALQVLQNGFRAFDERRNNQEVFVNQGCICGFAEFLAYQTATLGFVEESKAMVAHGVYCISSGGGYYSRTRIKDLVSEMPPFGTVQEVIRDYLAH